MDKEPKRGVPKGANAAAPKQSIAVSRRGGTEPPLMKRVAIYCRKSTEEGLDTDFNSLDAQRACCEQYIASQKSEGWRALPEIYEDGGFSGSNTERPALKRLLADVEAGKVDVIAVYKLDRLSRSQKDFVNLLGFLEEHDVAFVSVTQHFNTTTSMGRLMLNILISFAQFERENMIERVKDKIGQTKRLGKWCGGHPPLGYDVAPEGRRLLINEFEAGIVRQIYALYLERRSTSEVARVAAERGWLAKAWTTRKGRQVGGTPMSRSAIAKLLGNILYTGRIRYEGAIYSGEHPAIIDLATWDLVQAALAEQRVHGGPRARTKHFPLLKGLLRCKACGAGMTYTYTRKAGKLYGYYACASARVNGNASCPMPSLPAGELERMAVDEVAGICRSPKLSERVLREAKADHRRVERAAKERHREAEQLATKAGKAAERAPADQAAAALWQQAQAQLAQAQLALEELRLVDPDRPDARELLQAFEPVWAELGPRERQQLLRHLVDHITIDGEEGTATFTFKAEGIAELARLGTEARP